MKKNYFLFTVFAFLVIMQISVAQTYHPLASGSFTQNWDNLAQISVNDDWSGVTSIIGYRGDDAALGTGVDPQTLLNPSFSTVIDVNANQTAPNTFTTGGVTEFEITEPTIALSGSGTADAPNIVVYLNTSGCNTIHVKFNVKDIDGSTDNSTQQFALQYRTGGTGDFVNIPEAYIADASTGPSLATLVTNMDILLPVACENQAQVEIRFISSNAVGNDEWLGIDDIDISASTSSVPTITITSPAAGVEWMQGTTHDITWTASSTNTNVWIEYSGNASDPTPTWVPLNEAEVVAASAGTFTVIVPADLPPSTDSRIRISDIPETVSSLSNIFTITAAPAPAPVLTFSPADAAINVKVASDITITSDVPIRNIDDSEITDANVASLLSMKVTDAAGEAVPFSATIDVSKTVITINPDADLAHDQLYFVAIAPVEGLNNTATSAQAITFTTASVQASILSDLTIAETGPYTAGDLITINWLSENVTDVKIEAWVPSENAWLEVYASTPSDGSETFIIPVDASYSTDYKLRITDLANPTVTAESSMFTIIGAISEVSISEAAPYYAGDELTVNWIAKNISTVKIELYDPVTFSWNELENNVNAADGSKKITLPADLPTNTEYKLKVTNEENNTGVETGTFEGIAVATDLITLRAQPVGVKVKFSGIATVTYSRSTRNQKYIQDATAAMLIDDPNPKFITGTYNIGDGITNIVGKISLYNDLQEFVPIADAQAAVGTPIEPEVRTIESLTPADQCKLVKIENFAFKTPTQYDAAGKFVASKNYDVDGIDNTVFAYRTAFPESDYIGGFVPVGPITSIVLVGQFKTQMQITARSWSDMTVPTAADFEADQTFVLTGENIQFTDMSSNHPTSWEWTFDGGTPSTSTEQNPIVSYAEKGTYSVTLKVTNPSGGTNTITKTDYISIGVVGIPSTSAAISVYPNPTHGNLFITNPVKQQQEIVIFNAVGKQVTSSSSAKDIISLDLEGLSGGIYLVKITNAVTKAVQFKKVVLK